MQGVLAEGAGHRGVDNWFTQMEGNSAWCVRRVGRGRRRLRRRGCKVWGFAGSGACMRWLGVGC
eukprot:171615-Chlamydomonas_euryale.AAC.2